MFKVKIGEDEYEVSFDHHIPSELDRNDDPIAFRQMFGTVCFIEKPDKYIVTGIADLSIKDNFNRNTGRKVSLADALKKLFPDDNNKRLKFWQAYYQARGNKW